MKKAYKIEIKPTQEQKAIINRTIGVCRFVYNLYLTENRKSYSDGKGFITAFTFSKWFNNVFIPNNPSYNWAKEVSSKAVKKSICNGEAAYKKFFKGEAKFPKYKKKSRTDVKMYLPKNNKGDWCLERHRVKIPTLGFVRLKEFGYIPLDSVIKSGTVSKEADRYFVSILCEFETAVKKVLKLKQSEPIGIDLGIKDLAICSNGKTFRNINKGKKIKSLEKKLKREQRSLSRKLLKNKLKGGANKNSTNIKKNVIRVQKLHMRIANIRNEYVRFVVNSLVKLNPKFIAIEDLNVSGMMKNKHLSKAIASQKFYYFRTFLIQQCKKCDIEVRIIYRYYPSSKKCSCCGNINKNLKLSDRIYTCECGNSIDRDYNAGINIRDCETYKVA